MSIDTARHLTAANELSSDDRAFGVRETARSYMLQQLVLHNPASAIENGIIKISTTS
jgi:hypothetical protein